jgi:hypothetical protein
MGMGLGWAWITVVDLVGKAEGGGAEKSLR